MSLSITTTTSIEMPTLVAATATAEATRGSTIHNTVAAPRIRIGRQQTGLVAPRGAIRWQIGRQVPGRTRLGVTDKEVSVIAVPVSEGNNLLPAIAAV